MCDWANLIVSLFLFGWVEYLGKRDGHFIRRAIVSTKGRFGVYLSVSCIQQVLSIMTIIHCNEGVTWMM